MVAELINYVLDILVEEDMVSDDEREANKWHLTRREGAGFYEATVEAPQLFFSDFDNKKITQRISVFLNGLLMGMPNMPVWENIRRATTMTPVAKRENIVYFYKQLDTYPGEGENTGFTALSYLASLTPDEWHNFIKRMEKEGKATSEEFERMRNLKFGDRLGQVSGDLEWEIRLWASNRVQPFNRTLRGWMHYVSVLRIYAKMNHPEWDEETITKEVHEKYQFLWAIAYGEMAKEKGELKVKANDIETLVKYYYKSKKHQFIIDITSIEKDDNDKVFYSILRRFKPCPVTGGKIEDVHKIKLTKEHPLLSEAKPGAQTHARRFARGEIIFTIDINQDFYVEQALKIPHLLTLYDDKTVALVGYPEDIFTESFNLIGKFFAIADRTFTTLIHRVLALLGSRLHYGHPDAWRASTTDKFGGVSRSFPVNEDIFGGYELKLKGKKILFVEWIEGAKGRETSWGTHAGFLAKLGMGGSQQAYNRYLHALNTSHNYDWTQRLTNFFGGIGFMLRKKPVVIGNFGYLIFLLLMGISGFSALDRK